MSKPIKIIIETEDGRRVARTFKATWEPDVVQDLSDWSAGQTAIDGFFDVVADAIAEGIDAAFVRSMLEELANVKTKEEKSKEDENWCNDSMCGGCHRRGHG